MKQFLSKLNLTRQTEREERTYNDADFVVGFPCFLIISMTGSFEIRAEIF